MERNRQKMVGRDKGSLTQQQTEGTGTTMIQKRRKHDKTDRRTDPLSWTGPAPRAPYPLVSSRRAALPTGTQRDVTWDGVGSAHPAVPLPGFR